MRPTRLSLAPAAATAFSPWMTIDYAELAFSIGLAALLSSNANLSYTVQHTFDDTSDDAFRYVSISNTANVATVTDSGPAGFGPNLAAQGAGHGLSVGDSIIVIGSGVGIDAAGDTPAHVANVASVISQTQYTYATGVAGTVNAGPGTRLKSFRVFPHSVLAALAVRQNSNYAFPITAVRLTVSAWVAGYIDLLVVQGHGK